MKQLLQRRSSPSELSRNSSIDDADIAAGQKRLLASPPNSVNTINTEKGHPTDLEFFEDLVSEPVLVLGIDISHLSRQGQFVVCATGVFGFSLLYGYLQELIAVELCGRQLGLFQAMMQFSGYTILSYILRTYVYAKQRKMDAARFASTGSEKSNFAVAQPVPLLMYLGLSLLRALDLGMTNTAMQYINYPAKTLMKSSRVVFTMMFGVVIARKKYHCTDYLIVLAMVAGLALFMHADANSSAVFHHWGVIMLTISLICDGAISNMSENIMSQFGVGQDEFIFRMYSIALVAISAAAYYKGDLQEGVAFLSVPGRYDELHLPLDERTWSVPGKIGTMVLFSSMGFFGSSCSACITKNFGALTMSITSTARKATTLFLSFFLFNNVCTPEHVMGIVVFITALTTKSLRRGRSNSGSSSKRFKRTKSKTSNLELPQAASLVRNRTSSAESLGVPIRRSAVSSPEREEYSITGLHVV
jgi:hypothetical protein